MEATSRHRFPAVLRAALLAIPALAALLLLSACESTGSYGPGAGHFHTVIVDAGHGAHDRGARAVSGQPEKLLTLDTAHRLAKILRHKGFHVIETRPRETFIPLGTRTAISNKAAGAIFVSIHYNWARRAAPHGIEIYYYSSRSHRLAANILQEVRRAYPTINRGVKRNNYYVLRNNKRPAVLCELGFLSSPHDNRYAQSWWYRQKLAERIAQGIIDEQKGLSP
jgi:N-acetylmuramoyl-L-alanine amidase